MENAVLDSVVLTEGPADRWLAARKHKNMAGQPAGLVESRRLTVWQASSDDDDGDDEPSFRMHMGKIAAHGRIRRRRDGRAARGRE